MTAKKTRIPCTFSFEAAKTMIGQEMSGSGRRFERDPYSMTVPGTNKKITLDYTYAYDHDPVSVEEVVE